MLLGEDESNGVEEFGDKETETSHEEVQTAKEYLGENTDCTREDEKVMCVCDVDGYESKGEEERRGKSVEVMGGD